MKLLNFRGVTFSRIVPFIFGDKSLIIISGIIVMNHYRDCDKTLKIGTLARVLLRLCMMTDVSLKI